MNAGILSRIFFSFMFPLLFKAWRNKIGLKDLRQHPSNFEAAGVDELFRVKSQRSKSTRRGMNSRYSKNDHSDNNSQTCNLDIDNGFFASLHWILIKCFWRRIMAGSLLRFAALVFNVLQVVVVVFVDGFVVVIVVSLVVVVQLFLLWESRPLHNGDKIESRPELTKQPAAKGKKYEKNLNKNILEFYRYI